MELSAKLVTNTNYIKSLWQESRATPRTSAARILSKKPYHPTNVCVY